MKSLASTSKLLFFSLLFAFFSYGFANHPTSKRSSIREIILVGDDKVIIIDYAKSSPEKKHISWELKACEIIGLPDSLQGYFNTMDDAKSVENNTKLLISSSGGGVVLVDRETKKCLFYAKAPNAHSVEYLPNDRIAVALSTAEGGNRIEVYDVHQSDVPLYSDSLFSGHGVTWNKEQERLYALGYDKLRAYSLDDWASEKPALKLEQEWTLPATGGHDLFAPSSNQLLLSTSKEVWAFNIQEERFSPFEPIADVENVKSIYFNEETKEVIYTKGEISWWTHQVHFLNPEKTLPVPEMKLYKIRVIH